MLDTRDKIQPLAGGTHETHHLDSPDHVALRRLTNLALQLRLGVLPQRGTWARRADNHYPDAARSYLTDPTPNLKEEYDDKVWEEGTGIR